MCDAMEAAEANGQRQVSISAALSNHVAPRRPALADESQADAKAMTPYKQDVP